MNDLISVLIHSSKGYSHQTAGMIIGFFSNAEQARRCAKEIKTTYGKAVEICGSQLSISL